jgi:hypothetical protein
MRTAKIDAERFRDWLSQREQFSDRVMSDTVSRTRRALTLVNSVAASTEAEAVFRLTQAHGFSELRVDVQSQLKKAMRLYYAFTTSGPRGKERNSDRRSVR